MITSETKKGFSCNGARLPSLEKTRILITEKTIEAIAGISKIEKIKIAYPVKYRIEVIERGLLPYNSSYKWLDARTCELESDSVEKALFFNG